MRISPGKTVGPFTIDKLMAESGMAAVYRAHNTAHPHLEAVLKVSRQDNKNADAFEDLIQNETKVLTMLRHPGVVHIYPVVINERIDYIGHADKVEGQPCYYSMEYLDGGSLSDHIKTISTKFSLEWRIELFYQMLIVVDYLHARGVAHCDLKPENILFRYKPQNEELPTPVLIDFGTWSDTQTLESHPAGTVGYSSRELLQLLFHIADREQLTLIPEKFDIWSLGAIFFEIITGEPLVQSRDQKRAVTSVIRGDLPTISSLNSSLPAALDVILKVMISKKPQDRPPAGELICALEELVAPPPRIKVRH